MVFHRSSVKLLKVLLMSQFFLNFFTFVSFKLREYPPASKCEIPQIMCAFNELATIFFFRLFLSHEIRYYMSRIDFRLTFLFTRNRNKNNHTKKGKKRRRETDPISSTIRNSYTALILAE